MPKAPDSAAIATVSPWRGGVRIGLACAALLLTVGVAIGQGQAPGPTPSQTLDQTPSPAEQLVLTRPWARVYARPSASSRHVAIVYGNDVLPVLERKDGWVKVRIGRKAVGWLSPQDASPTSMQEAPAPPAPPSSAPASQALLAAGSAAKRTNTDAALAALPARPDKPASADSLRQLGPEATARSKLTQVLLSHRDDVEAYRATRDMLTYHPVGVLPPLQGTAIPQQARETAQRLRVSVLIQEAQALVQDGKPWDAVHLYQSMVEGDPADGRAHLELLNLLTGIMAQAAKSSKLEDLGLAVSIYRKTYPGVPLPAEVEARVKGKK